MAKGPTARFAIDAAALVGYLDARTEHVSSGTPKRTRRLINGLPVDANAARIIRRWRAPGTTVTRDAAVRMLDRFQMTLDDFIDSQPTNPIIRGVL